MTTEQHHRMNCTPAQFTKFVAILDWMKSDAEYREFAGEFKADGRWRTLVAPRLAWNAFRAASDLYAIAVEGEAISSVQRDRDVFAMLQDKASLVDVAVVEVVPKGALF